MGSGGANGESFLRQLSHGGGIGNQLQRWNYSSPSYYHSTNGGSKRWGKNKSFSTKNDNEGKQMEEESSEKFGGLSLGMEVKKRVMVVIDHTTRAKQAMLWALTHITNKGDLLTLLHIIPHHHPSSSSTCSREDVPNLANSLGSICKACKPEVEVEALVIQGPKLATVLSQVKKLEAAVLVLSQSKPSPFCCLFRSSSEEFVEQCINKTGCLTVAVRKQSKGIGGYLVTTRWQKNFWLLA